MTRDDVKDSILSISNTNILCQLATGVGKSKIALDIINNKHINNAKVLIVYPKIPLKDNWVKEIIKWKYDKIAEFHFTCYNSIQKYIGEEWDFIIYDECHHISERVASVVKLMKVTYNILLSATVNRKVKCRLESTFTNLYTYTLGIKRALEEEILPDPKIILFPMYLDNTDNTFEIIKNPNATGVPIITNYSQRWNYKSVKDRKVIIKCTQLQYYIESCGYISWLKKRGLSEQHLRESKKRLEWLSSQKVDVTKEILKTLKNRRVLTYCASIEQTSLLGKNCIHSKNKEKNAVLDAFNNMKIKHITSVQMLDEGMNLASCQVGIFNYISSSETIVAQRSGRILRHKNPVFIIPYYANTREEEIVDKMCLNYDSSLIIKCNKLEDMKI